MRTPFAEDDFQPTAATINPAWRAQAREIADLVRFLAENQGTPVGGVVGGFACSESSALVTTVGEGAGFIGAAGNDGAYDGVGGVQDNLSKWQWVHIDGDGLTATHDAHDSDPRWDLISISTTPAADTPETLNAYGGGPTPSKNTQFGSGTTITITKGTPHASAPTLPSLPSGHMAICGAKIPGGSGAIVYDEGIRTMLGGQHFIDVAPVIAPDVVDLSPSGSHFSYIAALGTGTDGPKLQISRISTTDCTLTGRIPIPLVNGAGVDIKGGRVVYRSDTAFDGTTTITFRVYAVNSSGVAQLVKEGTLDNDGAGTIKTLTLEVASLGVTPSETGTVRQQPVSAFAELEVASTGSVGPAGTLAVLSVGALVRPRKSL